MESEAAKQLAARAAMAELPESGIIGLGTGSTAKYFVEYVGEAVRQGKSWVGVPTSEQSRALAQKCSIPLLDAEGPWQIDVNVDGADEVDPSLNVIKGGGGAHTREKIVNQAARKNVIIVTDSKMSTQLGSQRGVPVEVLPFAHLQTARLMAKFGNTVLRTTSSGPTLTDSGNFLYDLFCGPIRDPGALDALLRSIPGVVETGLFVGRVDVVLIAEASGSVRRIQSAAARPGAATAR